MPNLVDPEFICGMILASICASLANACVRFYRATVCAFELNTCSIRALGVSRVVSWGSALHGLLRVRVCACTYARTRSSLSAVPCSAGPRKLHAVKSPLRHCSKFFTHVARFFLATSRSLPSLRSALHAGRARRSIHTRCCVAFTPARSKEPLTAIHGATPIMST